MDKRIAALQLLDVITGSYSVPVDKQGNLETFRITIDQLVSFVRENIAGDIQEVSFGVNNPDNANGSIGDIYFQSLTTGTRVWQKNESVWLSKGIITGVQISDAEIRPDKTWSSEKINNELSLRFDNYYTKVESDIRYAYKSHTHTHDEITDWTAAFLNSLSAQKGVANGVTPLNENVKIDETYLPDSILGAVRYQTIYNVPTNQPPLPVAAPANRGFYYIIGQPGTVGGIEYKAGDWIISDGSSWGKVDNTDAVTTVFGRIGNIVANAGDYNTDQVTEAGNKYFTTERVLQTALTGYIAGNNEPLAAADTVLLAFGKLQAQLTSLGQKAILDQTAVLQPATFRINKGIFDTNSDAVLSLRYNNDQKMYVMTGANSIMFSAQGNTQVSIRNETTFAQYQISADGNLNLSSGNGKGIYFYVNGAGNYSLSLQPDKQLRFQDLPLVGALSDELLTINSSGVVRKFNSSLHFIQNQISVTQNAGFDIGINSRIRARFDIWPVGGGPANTPSPILDISRLDSSGLLESTKFQTTGLGLEITNAINLYVFNGTGAVRLPSGTTAQRPSALTLDAYIRKNSTLNAIEHYNFSNSTWYTLWDSNNLYPFQNTTQGTITDWNTLPSEGLMHGTQTATNGPSLGFFTAFNVRADGNTQFNNIIGVDNNSKDWYVRSQQNGVWGLWRRIWDSGNSNLATVDWFTKTLVTNQAIGSGDILIRNGGLNRWSLYKVNTETGSNAGSDLVIASYNDAGSLLLGSVGIRRSDSYVRMLGNVSIGSTNYATTGKLEVLALNSIPADSGNVLDASLSITNLSGVGLFFGQSSSNLYSWIQSRSNSNYATQRPLYINQNGGQVAIGGVPLEVLSSLYVNGGVNALWYKNVNLPDANIPIVFVAGTSLSNSYSFTHTTGSTNFPYTTGGGFAYDRVADYSNTSAIGSFKIWTAAAADTDFQFKKLIAPNTWSAWYKFYHSGNDGLIFKDRTNGNPFLTDLNNGNGIGTYAWNSGSATNAPTPNAGALINIPYNYNGLGQSIPSSSWSHQLAFPQIGGNGDMYYRYYNGTTFSGWSKFWHSGNSNMPTVDWHAQTITSSRAPGVGSFLIRNVAGVSRWAIYGINTETGTGNVGYDFAILRYTDAGTGLLNQLVIKRDTGYLGIGTNSPSQMLSVAGAAVIGTGTVNANTTKLFINNPAGKTWALSAGLNTINENDFGIYNWSDSGVAARLMVTAGGFVGIGTNQPAYPLDVAGRIACLGESFVFKAGTVAGNVNAEFIDTIWNASGTTVGLLIGSIGANAGYKNIGIYGHNGTATKTYASFGDGQSTINGNAIINGSLTFSSVLTFGTTSNTLLSKNPTTGKVEEMTFSAYLGANAITNQNVTYQDANFKLSGNGEVNIMKASNYHYNIGVINGTDIYMDMAGMKVATVSANTNYTLLNSDKGIGCKVRFNNTGASTISLSFTSPVGTLIVSQGTDLTIAAGKSMVVTFMRFESDIWISAIKN